MENLHCDLLYRILFLYVSLSAHTCDIMNLSFGTTLTPGVLIQRHSFDLAFDLGFNCVHTLASTPVMCLIAGSWNYFAQGEDLLSVAYFYSPKLL